MSSMALLYCLIVYLIPDPSYLRQCIVGRFLLILIAMSGCFLSGTIARVVQGAWLAHVGVASLGIMLIHKFLVVGIQTRLKVFRVLVDESSCMAVLMVLLVSITIAYSCLVLTWPIKHWFPWILGEVKRNPVSVPSEPEKE